MQNVASLAISNRFELENLFVMCGFIIMPHLFRLPSQLVSEFCAFVNRLTDEEQSYITSCLSGPAIMEARFLMRTFFVPLLKQQTCPRCTKCLRQSDVGSSFLNKSCFLFDVYSLPSLVTPSFGGEKTVSSFIALKKEDKTNKHPFHNLAINETCAQTDSASTLVFYHGLVGPVGRRHALAAHHNAACNGKDAGAACYGSPR